MEIILGRRKEHDNIYEYFDTRMCDAGVLGLFNPNGPRKNVAHMKAVSRKVVL